MHIMTQAWGEEADEAAADTADEEGTTPPLIVDGDPYDEASAEASESHGHDDSAAASSTTLASLRWQVQILQCHVLFMFKPSHTSNVPGNE